MFFSTSWIDLFKKMKPKCMKRIATHFTIGSSYDSNFRFYVIFLDEDGFLVQIGNYVQDINIEMKYSYHTSSDMTSFVTGILSRKCTNLHLGKALSDNLSITSLEDVERLLQVESHMYT